MKKKYTRNISYFRELYVSTHAESFKMPQANLEIKIRPWNLKKPIFEHKHLSSNDIKQHFPQAHYIIIVPNKLTKAYLFTVFLPNNDF